LLGWLTQSLHDKRLKQDIKQEHLPACTDQHSGFWTFFVLYALISYIVMILVESHQYWYSYRKIPNWSNPIFQEENFSFFEDSRNGPTIITLLPLTHCIDFRSKSEC